MNGIAADIQEIEGINSVIRSAINAAPAINLELLNSGTTLKKMLAPGGCFDTPESLQQLVDECARRHVPATQRMLDYRSPHPEAYPKPAADIALGKSLKSVQRIAGDLPAAKCSSVIQTQTPTAWTLCFLILGLFPPPHPSAPREWKGWRSLGAAAPKNCGSNPPRIRHVVFV